MGDLEQRMIDLEMRIAFQEQALQELSDALAAARDGEARNALLLHRAVEELRQLRSAIAASPITSDPESAASSCSAARSQKSSAATTRPRASRLAAGCGIWTTPVPMVSGAASATAAQSTSGSLAAACRATSPSGASAR